MEEVWLPCLHVAGTMTVYLVMIAVQVPFLPIAGTIAFIWFMVPVQLPCLHMSGTIAKYMVYSAMPTYCWNYGHLIGLW